MSTGWHSTVTAGVIKIRCRGGRCFGGRPVRGTGRPGARRRADIAMSRHESRQKIATAFGATDIVTERGDDVTAIMELTDGIGADAVCEIMSAPPSR